MAGIIGPLGFWKFPFVNKFIGPKLSIKDHKVISGKPNYISNHEILVSHETLPFKIKMRYDTKIMRKEYIERADGALVLARTSPFILKRGETLEVPESFILVLQQEARGRLIRVFVFEQIEPR